MRGDAQPILTGFCCIDFCFSSTFSFFSPPPLPPGWTKTLAADKTDKEKSEFVWVWSGGGWENLWGNEGFAQKERNVYLHFTELLSWNCSLYIKAWIYQRSSSVESPLQAGPIPLNVIFLTDKYEHFFQKDFHATLTSVNHTKKPVLSNYSIKSSGHGDWLDHPSVKALITMWQTKNTNDD